jgi:hypothetical protein
MKTLGCMRRAVAATIVLVSLASQASAQEAKPLRAYPRASAEGKTTFSVANRLAIRNLIDSYALAFDNYDADAWFRLFTPDAVFAVGTSCAPHLVQSGEAFYTFWRDRIATFKRNKDQRRHLMSNVTFIEETESSAHVSIVGLLTNARNEQEFSVVTTLNYEGWFVKAGNEWKIRRWHDYPDSCVK